MENLLTVTVLYENDILPGKDKTKYNLLVESDKLSFTNIKTREKIDLYYNNLDIVELGIYKKDLLFQCTYMGCSLVFYPSVKTWKTEAAINLLKSVNRYTPILDPIKYYKAIITEPKILKKKDFDPTQLDAIYNDIKLFNEKEGFKDSFDFQIMDINLKSFLIKRLIEEKETDKAIEEYKNLINRIEEFNKQFDNYLLPLVVYYDISILKYLKTKEEKIEFINKGRKDADILVEKENTLLSKLYKTDILYDANFMDEFLDTANIEDINYMLDSLREGINSTDDTSFYVDLSSLIGTIFSNLKPDFIKEGKIELIDELINALTTITNRSDYHRNYSALSYAYGIKAHYYSEKEDLIETKNALIKEEELIKTAISKLKIVPKHYKGNYLMSNNYGTAEDLDHHYAQLVEVLLGRTQVAISYKNVFEELKFLEECIKIYDGLVSKKFYKEDNDNREENLAEVYSIFISLAEMNGYENIEFLSACNLRFYTLAKDLLEKKETKELYEYLIDSSNAVIKLIYMFDRTNKEKFKYFEDMLRGADGVLKFEPDNPKAHDAKTFILYSLFEEYKDTDKAKAKEFALQVVENYNYIQPELKEMEVYMNIIDTVKKYIDEN